MANINGVFQPAEGFPGVTGTLAATTASAIQTLYPNAIFIVTIAATAGTAAGATITFGGSGATSQLGSIAAAPAVPSATVGYFLNANTVSYVFWLGPNRDSFRLFNNTAASITFSYLPLMP